MNNFPISETSASKESWSKPELTVLDVKASTLFDVGSPGTDAYTSES